MDLDELLTVEEALPLTPYKNVSTLYDAMKEGRLQFVAKGRMKLISREALNAYIAQKGKRRPGAGRPRKEQTNG